jgi:ribonucleoside-diphosphate reductase alpha chain
MVERVVNDIAGAERLFSVSAEDLNIFADKLGNLIDGQMIVFSTPIMTNAWRTENKPLSACTVPSVDLRGDLKLVKKTVDSYHQEAMGTGFNLSDVDDPVAVLLFLNNVAVSGAESGTEDRPVGNMAICRIDHPMIIDFIQSKRHRRDINWKFNISVDVPERFWQAIETNSVWTLTNGKTILANDLFQVLVESAHECADPGLICLDRFNSDNPTPGVGLYTSTAPCAEVGLIPGETCQFGYINVAKFINGAKVIDYEKLAETAHVLTHALDNVVELNIGRYSVRESAQVMLAKRKIGVGVCGISDMLIEMGIPYDSDEGRNICRDIIAFINYQTKIESVNLAKKRGSFEAMKMMSGCLYNENPGFIEHKYGQLETRTVSKDQWRRLGASIRETRLLRNSSTIALPPTGRSAMVIDASASIEPPFMLTSSDGSIHKGTMKQLIKGNYDSTINLRLIQESGSCQLTDLPDHMKAYLKTATEIDQMGHLNMISAIQPCVDEFVSKTINLPSSATSKDIGDIYIKAHESGLKGITIYRDGSLRYQPKRIVQ